MTIEEEIRILDPETSREALQPYAYDTYQRHKVVEEACRVAVDELRQCLAFKGYFVDLYGKGLAIANWHKNGDLEPFDNFFEDACC